MRDLKTAALALVTFGAGLLVKGSNCGSGEGIGETAFSELPDANPLGNAGNTLSTSDLPTNFRIAVEPSSTPDNAVNILDQRQQLESLRRVSSSLKNEKEQAHNNFTWERWGALDSAVAARIPEFQMYIFERLGILDDMGEEQRANLSTWLRIFPIKVSVEEGQQLANINSEPLTLESELQVVALLGKERILQELTRAQILRATDWFNYSDFVTCFGDEILSVMEDYDSHGDVSYSRDSFDEWKNRLPETADPEEYDDESDY